MDRRGAQRGMAKSCLGLGFVSRPLVHLRKARLNMPALIPSGPKLPSFQKLKSKKRARTQVEEEPKHAPKSKKPTTVALPKHVDSNDSEVKAEKPRKAQKKNAWNKRMAEERRDRIDKRDTKTTAPVRPARTKAAPGSNWEQLKVRKNPIQLVL